MGVVVVNKDHIYIYIYIVLSANSFKYKQIFVKINRKILSILFGKIDKY